MKRGIAALILLAILILPTALAEAKTQETTPTSFHLPTSNEPKPSINPWNKTIIISDTWQAIIGPFFGLNLKNVSTKISVREALVFFAIFVMFLAIIFNTLKLTPFFKSEKFPTEFIAATIITILVSISGALINLKDLFIQAVSYTITKLNLDIFASNSIITGILVIVSFIIIVLFFKKISPVLERYSKISKAQAKGRRLNSAIEKTEEI